MAHIVVLAVVLQQQETVYLPELLHNITLLVEKTEHEIVTGDKKYAVVLLSNSAIIVNTYLKA